MKWVTDIRTEGLRGYVVQIGLERDHEFSRLTRKVKDMRRVVFWGPKVFEATGPAHRGRFLIAQ